MVLREVFQPFQGEPNYIDYLFNQTQPILELVELILQAK